MYQEHKIIQQKETKTSVNLPMPDFALVTPGQIM